MDAPSGQRFPRRPTLKDVAERAGVGTMTASRVATGRGYVAPATRARVEAVIAELGYLPNGQAQSLRSSRTGLVALIVSDLTNPYFTTLAHGLEVAARRQDSMLLVTSSDESAEEELRCAERLVRRGIDGLVLVPSQDGAAAIRLAQERGIPCVVADRRGPPGVDVVRADSGSGAAAAARRLLASGHRRVGIIAGECGISTSDDRVAGFASAFADGGGTVELVRAPLTVDGGRTATRRLLAADPGPTALFAVNNFLSIGAFRALAEDGRRVPEDVSLIGFDDLPAAMLAFPFLTVVGQPAREIGVRAAARLFARIADPASAPAEEVLPTELIERSSVGPPPSRGRGGRG